MNLQKLIQWEKTVAAQKKKRTWLSGVAVACTILMLMALWLIQKKLYGDVVQTGASVYFGISVGIGIGLFLHSGREEKPTQDRKNAGWGIALLLCVLCVVWIIFREKILLNIVQICCAYLPALWLARKQNTDCDTDCLLACVCILIAVMVPVGTFVGAKLMRLTSLPSVEKTIAAEGFTDVEYDTWWYGHWLKEEGNTEKKYYVFTAKKDGQDWRIAADPKGGRLVQIAEEELGDK